MTLPKSTLPIFLKSRTRNNVQPDFSKYASQELSVKSPPSILN